MKQYPSLPSTTRIDTHCHLFNKKVLSWRLLVDFVQSRVELPLYAANADLLDACSSKLQGIKRALHFLKTGMQSSSEEVYKTLTQTEKGYAVVPLMFDLDYCMKGASVTLPDEILAAYHQALADDREELLQMQPPADCFHRKNSPDADDTPNEITLVPFRQRLSTNPDADDTPNEIAQLLQTIDTLLEPDCKVNTFELDLLHKEDPFLDQENQLVALQQKYLGTVFPFYAVDPRRKENYTLQNGTYDLNPVLRRLAIHGGSFYGIKLYTPNGYSPATPMLMALYQYCEAHAIPITAHCSGGGFASFAKTVHIQGLIYQDGVVCEHHGDLTFRHYKITDKERVHEKAQLLNHPLIWEKVLEQYPNLILNLAHFGSSEGSEEWSRHILRLMKKFPNLYTDFSCVADKATLDTMYQTYYSKAEPSIQKRFLYGSDFYLNMLFIHTMKQYIGQFEKTFSSAEMKEITTTNPRKFLGLQARS